MDIPATSEDCGRLPCAAIANAVGVPSVDELWVRYGGDGEEEALPLDAPRLCWRLLSSLEPGDLLLVVGQVSRVQTVHSSGL